jgi:hypothetical protein
VDSVQEFENYSEIGRGLMHEICIEKLDGTCYFYISFNDLEGAREVVSSFKHAEGWQASFADNEASSEVVENAAPELD